MKRNLFAVPLMYLISLFVQAQCPGEQTERYLVIRWQNAPCQSTDPCEACLTGPQEIRSACERLRSALALLNIKVMLDEQTVAAGESVLLINGRGIEQWLGGKLVKRQCASCQNGNSDTKVYALELDGSVYEAISSDMIIRAGLLAASEIYAARPSAACELQTPCPGCPGKH
jgi:hypothetical protein